MRPGHPSVSWGSTLTSWATILYVLLYFFLPHRLPELELPLQASVDVPAPAAVGQWTMVDDAATATTATTTTSDGNQRGPYWMLDPVTHNIQLCTAATAPQVPALPLCPRTNATWRWGPRPRQTDPAAAAAGGDGSSGGWAYIFSKIGVHVAPTHAVSGGDGPRTLLLDARLWWKQGLVATSALQQMRVVGSNIAQEEEKGERGVTDDGGEQQAPRRRRHRHHTFRVLGVTPPTWGHQPLASLVGGASNASMKALAEAFLKHEAGNATVVESLFAAALAVKQNHSQAPAVNLSNLSDGSAGTSAPRSPPVESPMESPLCLWYGTVTVRRQDMVVPSAAESSTTSVSARGVVAGELYSLCGDHMVWEATEAMYVDMTSSWNLVVAPCAILPFLVLCYGLVQQFQWMRNSRARTLRVSRVQLLVIAMYILFYVCYAEMLWVSMPNNIKVVNLFYSIAFFAVMATLHLYATVDTEYRAAHNQDSSRSSVFLTYIIGSSLSNLIPILAKTAMFRAPVLMAGCGLFWVPQLVQLCSGSGKDALVPSFLIGATLIPVSFVGILLAAPASALAAHPDPSSLVCALLLVAAAGVAVHVGGKIGAARLLPRWMMPWAHVYHLPRHALRTFAGLAEDPECSICGESFEHPDDAHAATAHDTIWLTPCRHLFHETCLSQWMEQRMDCPLCRKALPEP